MWLRSSRRVFQMRRVFRKLRTSHKAIAVRIPTDRLKLGFGKAEVLAGDVKLAGERGPEDARVVSVESDWHSGVEKAADGMIFQRRNGPGHDVAGNADFKRNP